MVPVVVIGPPVNPVPVAIFVTLPLPVPAPMAVLKDEASNALTVLSSFILMKVIADGLVSVKRLLPTVVAPRDPLTVAPDSYANTPAAVDTMNWSATVAEPNVFSCDRTPVVVNPPVV